MSEHVGGFEKRRRLEALGYRFEKVAIGGDKFAWRVLDETGAIAGESATMGKAMFLAIEALGGL